MWCCKECPCAFGCLATSFYFYTQAEDKVAAWEEAEAEVEAKDKAAAKAAEKESKATAAKTDKEAKKDSKSMKEDKAASQVKGEICPGFAPVSADRHFTP